MKASIAIEIATKTDDGIIRKGHNEDNFTVVAAGWGHAMNRIYQTDRGSLLMVADGMGGTNAGEVASQIAVKSVESAMQKLTRVPTSDKNIEDFLVNIIDSAHNDIIQHARVHPDSAGMGTTAVLVWILGNKAYIAWCGDSRSYIYRRGITFRPRTDDHSLVWQEIVGDNYSAEKAEAARLHPDSNIITQSLGEESQPPKPSSKTVELASGDRIIVCSDGLNSMVSDRDIGAIVSRLDFSPKQICDQLIIAANAAGGTDNITVITADFDVNNSSQALGAAPIKDFQESSATEKTKMVRNILLGIVGGLAIATAVWWAFFRNPTPGAVELAKLEKHQRDSIAAHVADSIRKAADNSRDLADKIDANNSSKTDKTPPKKTDEKPDGKPAAVKPDKEQTKPIVVEPKPLEPTSNPKLVERMRKLVDKRAEIGDFLKNFPTDGLTPTLAKELKSLKEQGTAIYESLKNEGVLSGGNNISLTFNKEATIGRLELQIQAFENKVEKWCGETNATNCKF